VALVLTSAAYFFQIHFNIIIASILASQKMLRTFWFSDKSFVCIVSLSPPSEFNICVEFEINTSAYKTYSRIILIGLPCEGDDAVGNDKLELEILTVGLISRFPTVNILSSLRNDTLSNCDFVDKSKSCSNAKAHLSPLEGNNEVVLC